MQLNITGQNIDITDPLQDLVNVTFSKLEQFCKQINQVYIVLKIENFRRLQR